MSMRDLRLIDLMRSTKPCIRPSTIAAALVATIGIGVMLAAFVWLCWIVGGMISAAVAQSGPGQADKQTGATVQAAQKASDNL